MKKHYISEIFLKEITPNTIKALGTAGATLGSLLLFPAASDAYNYVMHPEVNQVAKNELEASKNNIKQTADAATLTAQQLKDYQNDVNSSSKFSNSLALAAGAAGLGTLGYYGIKSLLNRNKKKKEDENYINNLTSKE